MHDIIAFLKSAVDHSDTAGINSCYIIRDGNIYCRNVFLQAGVPMESEVEFNIPADALEKALQRMKQIESLTVDEGVVRIKAGRLRSAIRTVDGEPPPVPAVPTEWQKTPNNLAPALAAAKQHIGDMNWQNCVRLMNGRVTAFRSQSGIDIEVPGLTISPSLLTPEVVDFLVAQGGSDEYCAQGGSIFFRWDDGRWLRVQLYDAEMPEANIAHIFENAGTEIPVKITNEFREAYADISAMTDSVVLMTPEGFQGRTRDVANNAVEFKIKGLPKDHASYWDIKYLTPVIEQAAAWNPTTWPQPCYFEGPAFRGVIMGRQRW